MALAAADRHDLLRIVEIDPLDPDGLAEHLRAKGTRQMFLEHAEKTDALFRIAIRINNGFLNEGLKPPFAEPPTCGHLSLGIDYAAA